jgi:hypothetical protein
MIKKPGKHVGLLQTATDASGSIPNRHRPTKTTPTAQLLRLSYCPPFGLVASRCVYASHQRTFMNTMYRNAFAEQSSIGLKKGVSYYAPITLTFRVSNLPSTVFRVSFLLRIGKRKCQNLGNKKAIC